MLTDAQFYLRVLEETLRASGRPCCDSLRDSDDLAEYLEERLGVKNEDEDDGDSSYKAMAHVELTLQGFLQALGTRVGIDLKFIPQA